MLSLRIPVFNVLEDSCNIVLAHPKYVKAIRGKKTDKKDAKWIADLFKHDLIAGSFMPPLAIRQRRGHKKAIIAIARMLLTAIYNILKKKEAYNVELYRKSDTLPVSREISVEQAIILARTQGYRIRSAS